MKKKQLLLLRMPAMVLLFPVLFASCDSDSEMMQLTSDGDGEAGRKTLDNPPVESGKDGGPGQLRNDFKLSEEPATQSTAGGCLSCTIKKTLSDPQSGPLDLSEFMASARMIFDSSLCDDERSSLATVFTPVLHGTVRLHSDRTGRQEGLDSSPYVEITSGERVLGQVAAISGAKIYMPILRNSDPPFSPVYFSIHHKKPGLSLDVNSRIVAAPTGGNKTEDETNIGYSLTLDISFPRTSYDEAADQLKNKIMLQASQLSRELTEAHDIAAMCEGEDLAFFVNNNAWITQMKESEDILSALITAVEEGQVEDLKKMRHLDYDAANSRNLLMEIGQFHILMPKIARHREALYQTYRDLNVLLSIEPICTLNTAANEDGRP